VTAVARPPGPGLLATPSVTLASMRRPHLAAQDLFRRHGPVVRLGRGATSVWMLFGPAANELILSERPDSFTWHEAMAILEPVDGPTALVLTDGEDHRRRRRIVQPAFATRRIDAAVPVAVAEVDAAIDGCAPGATVDLHELFRRTMRRIVVRVLFGDSLADRADALGAALGPAMAYIDRIPQLQFRGAPGSGRAKRARRAADSLVDAEIARRRDTGDLGGDVLGMLLATDLTEPELRDQVVSLIAAGYDTTSAAAAWTVLALLRTPGEWHRVRGDVEQRLGTEGRAPDAEDLRAMPYVGAAVNEALRLWPPGSLSGRRCHEGFTFAGHEVPPESNVLFSPYVTQRMPEVWGDDAADYRPGRWSAGDPPPFGFIPFGGPYRRCLGFALALTELQVAVVRLAQRTSLRLVDPGRVVLGRGISALVPEGGVPVVVDAVD
jgi:cytochrome P450